MLQNLEIYEHALALLSLELSEEENEDLAERAPYHLAAFCAEAEEVDRFLRMSVGAGAPLPFNSVCMPLDGDFPLSERLAPVAALYLASLLILDEDPERSERLYDRYTEALSDVYHGIPATLESIKEVYL